MGGNEVEPLSILLVDDDADIGKLMKLKLSKEAPSFSFHFVEGAKECLEYIGSNRVDCILSDYQMPEINGMELLLELRNRGNDVPFIFLTGQGNEEVAREAFKGGAYDYFTKDIGFAHFTRIINSVKQAVAQRTAETERKRAEIERNAAIARFETLLDNMDSLVYVADMESYEILLVNAYGRSVWGDVKGKVCWQVLQAGQSGPCPFCTNDRLLDAAGFPTGVYVWEFQNTVNKEWYECRDQAIRWVDGRLVRLEVASNITERKQAEEALKQSGQRLRLHVQLTPLAVIEWDLNFCVTSWNPSAEKIFGYSAAEAMGRHAGFILPDSAKPHVDRVWSELLVRMGGERSTNENMTKDGRTILCEWYNTPLIDDDGRVLGVASLVQDISEQKRSEKRIENLTRVYAALSKVSQLIVKTTDRQTLFEGICRIAVDEGKFLMAWVGLVDEETRMVKPVASHGYDEGYTAGITISAKDEPEGCGPTGTSIREEKHFICNNIENAPRMQPWRDEALKRGYKSSAAFPIMLGPRAIGAFMVYSSEPDFFAEDEVSLLDEMAAAISFALQALDTEEKRKRTEGKLAEQREFLLKTLDSLTHSFYVIDADNYQVIMANPAASFDILPGHNTCYALTHHLNEPCSGDAFICTLDKVKETKMPVTVEHVHYDNAGNERVFEVHGYPILDNDSNVSQMIAYSFDITERKRAEEALRESEERFHTLFESADDGIFLQEGGVFVDCNSKGVEMYGYEDKSDIIGHSPMEFAPPLQPDGESSERKATRHIAAVLNGAPQSFYWTPRRKDGTLMDVEVSLNTLKLKGKTYIQAIVRDITARRKTEEALAESERFLRAVFTSIQDGIVVLDNNLNVVRVNPTMEKWYADAMPLVGKKCYEVFYRRDRICDDCPSLRAFDTGKAATEEVPRRGLGGEVIGWHDLYSFPLVDTHTGERRGIVEYIRDTTERKKAEEQIRQLASIVESSGDAIIGKTLDGIILSWNVGAERIYGYSAEEIVGRPISLLLPPDRPDEFSRLIDRIKKGEYVDHYETVRLRKDGKQIYVSISLSPVKDDAGRIIGASSIHRDISEKKRLEEERKDFYAMITHDIKSPLSAIMGYSELISMEKSDKLGGDIKEMIGAINSAGARLHRVIGDFLSLSRMESGRMTVNIAPSDIKLMLSDVCKDLKSSLEEKKLSFDTEIMEGMPRVEIDQKLVQRAVCNLLQNAVNYTPASGFIKLKANTRDENDGTVLVISVTDSGHGIPTEERHKIFEKYYRSPNTAGTKGTGLGLAIVKAVAEAHGGRVELESEEGQGSTFRLVLPVN
jgi:PAS domain S-box-containing protein